MQRRLITPQKNEIPLLEKELIEKIIGAAIEVHRAIGPGLLESAYQLCLAQESRVQNITFEEQVPLKLNYKGIKLDGGYTKLISSLINALLLKLKPLKQYCMFMRPNCSPILN